MAGLAAVPTNPPTESSEEEVSNSEDSDSSDDSMEDKPSDSDNGETEAKANITKDEFWVRNSALKTFLGYMIRLIGSEFMSEDYVFEKAELMGDDKAKELNDKCEALAIKELEFGGLKLRLFSEVLSSMKP
ncbi:hypothetical protein CARUB_v10022101mg [Capsella rubella]|uniref:Uncharacterized protein n=1 Tax=Capsella rubella TaxID=81985 RepID=R0GCJ5_9BRAS|nr:uncharacterized protein LOC17894391 [Capsella rubella]EOA33326.1 hypothetical protein CARUB_v10022101mg [Capsella rubella]